MPHSYRPFSCPPAAVLGICLATVLFACSPQDKLPAAPDAQPEPPLGAEQVGIIANDFVREASGLAVSRYRERQLWVVNDGGWPPELHALGPDGADLGSTRVSNVKNIDWEDLASFRLNGARYLMIADIGDNGALRSNVALHFVPEPNPVGTPTTEASRTLRFRYPDGPRDAEGIAIDASEGMAYILSKRTVPAELYRVPLSYSSDTVEPVIAEYLGQLASLPQPTEEDLDLAFARKNWGWQPTAMDFADDGKSATIITYRAIYTYSRHEHQSWFDALQSEPEERSLGLYFGAESVAFDGDGIAITFEALHPPILRFPL